MSPANGLPPAWLLALIGLAGLGLAALAAAGDTLLDAARRSALAQEPRPGGAGEVNGRWPVNGRPTWLTVQVLGALGILMAGTAGTWWIASRALGPLPAGLALLGLALLVILLGQLLPRAWAARHSVASGRAVMTPIDLAARLLGPVFAGLAKLGLAPASPHGSRQEELRALLGTDEDVGPIEAEEMEMIAGIIELGQTLVHEVMVPRIDIVALQIDTPLDQALDIIIRAGHSRIPVFRSTIDDIAGLLYAKDLLLAFRKRELEAKIAGYLREAYFVPDSKPVDVLLAELQARQVHMAIVVDEYGGTAGLVTIEDLLEEIVGEIQDEYDVEQPRVELISADEGVFNAGLHIDDVNRMMGTQLPSEEVNTLAGLVFSALGRVPAVGERARFDDTEIEVLDLDGRRIQRVRVLRHPSALEPLPSDPARLPQAPSADAPPPTG